MCLVFRLIVVEMDDEMCGVGVVLNIEGFYLLWYKFMVGEII